MLKNLALGFDCGKTTDSPALVLIEARAAPVPLALRHLQRLPLGMAYPAQEAYVAALMRRPPLLGDCDLVVDGTGGGIVVVDHLEALGVPLISVSSHGGKVASANEAQTHFAVSKGELVACAVRVVEQRLIAVPRGLPEWPALVRELQMFVRRATKRPGGVAYEASAGAHDDLVMAFALACWRMCTTGRCG